MSYRSSLIGLLLSTLSCLAARMECGFDQTQAPEQVLMVMENGNAPLSISSLGVIDDWIIAGGQASQPKRWPEAVSVFRRIDDSWQEQEQLHFKVASERFHVGAAISMHDSLCAIGATLPNPQFRTSGVALLYRRTDNDWKLIHELTPPKGVVSPSFGSAVSLENDYCVVGAGDETFGDSLVSGKVYIFNQHEDAWQLQSQLEPPQGLEWFRFGHAVDLAYPYLAIAAAEVRGLDGVYRQSPVFIYRHEGENWVLDTTVLRSTNEPTGRTGLVRFQFDAGRLWVGGVAPNSGFQVAGYERKAGEWEKVCQFEHCKDDAPVQMTSFAVDGQNYVVGSVVANKYMVHIFRANTGSSDWELLTEIGAGDLAGDGVIGTSVAIHGTTVAVAEGSRKSPKPCIRVLSIGPTEDSDLTR